MAPSIRRFNLSASTIIQTTVLSFFWSVATAGEPKEPNLRRNLAWQIALERVGFSPGLIDGGIGPKTQLATREFQRVRGLPMTGILDASTAAALGVREEQALRTYTLSTADFLRLEPVPKNWIAKSKMSWLGYTTVQEAVAEKFHTSRRLLTQLNPGRALDSLKAGDTIQVPAISEPTAYRGESVEINLPQKVIRVFDDRARLVGLFHCSIAADRTKRPKGATSIVAVSHEPTYLFDPKMWPEVKGIDRKLLIQPGPRNPVGLCWIALGLPGYGIHGTPNPELIGKTGSHGCFRLTNWDAKRLAALVRAGVPVRFTCI